MNLLKNKKQKGFTHQKNNSFSGGFTLIELLVVIAIISLLSSVVLSSLNSARTKAKDATIKSQLAQMAILMNLNYSEYGSYCQLNVNFIDGWIPGDPAVSDRVGSCDKFDKASAGGVSGAANTSFGTGIYATKAVEICKIIYNNANPSGTGYYRFRPAVNTDCSKDWAFRVLLNNGKWYCTGSSGRKGEYNVADDPIPVTEPIPYGCPAYP